MSLFSQYIPLDRQQALSQGRNLPNRTQGAVLFADVAGFSPLTKALTQELGPQRGVEELSATIGLVYQSLITEIHQYGGVVIAFGGDGITCWFDQDEGARALTCALAMQEAMRPHTTISTPTGLLLTISLKISLAVGPARRFVVGDPDIQLIDALAGATLERVTIGEMIAQQGEILLDETGAAALAPYLHIKTWRQAEGHRFAVIGDFTRPVAPDLAVALVDLPDETARPWLLPPVYERLKRGEGDFLAELRLAVAMFVAFGGLDYDEDEDAGEHLDLYIRWVQRVLARYEGYLIDLSMGDKGTHLYAVFGALKAHENDPVRAVAAAEELLHPLLECHCIRDIRIGISRGRMRCGVTGSQSRKTYGVHGNEVNVAAQLMTLAQPQQILVTERVVSAPGQRVAFRLSGEVHLKKDLTPLKIYIPQEMVPQVMATSFPTWALPLIGREQEQDLVQGLLRQVRQDADVRYSVFIEGEAGIGKSHLLYNITVQARQLGLTPLIGEANAIEKSTPYYAWRMIFAQLMHQIAPAGVTLETPTAWREHVLGQLNAAAPFATQLAPLLNGILSLDLPENETTQGLSGEIRANNIRWILMALLQRAAQQGPLIFILEDIHWLDSASWALLMAMHQVVQPIVTVATLRPLSGSIPVEYTLLRRQPTSYHLPLSVLTHSQIRDLICQRLKVSFLPEPVVELIHSKAEGHPFFSEELAYTLRDAGLIMIENEVCRLTPQADDKLRLMNFPDTIEGVITSRIDLLPAQQQLALKVGSVIGRAFAYRTLYDIHPVEADKPQLHLHLSGLEKLNVLAAEHLGTDTSYLFKHVLFQEVAYNLMTFSQRRQLHEQIATWYEQIYADDQSQFYSLLAYHWTRAENAPKALVNLEQAGEQAFLSFANEEAITFFNQALTLDAKTGYHTEPLRRAGWELRLGEAQVQQSRYQEGQKHLEAGVALLGYPVAARGRAGLGLLKEVVVQLAHRYFPATFFGRAMAQQDTLIRTTRAYNRLTEVYYFNGETTLSLFTAIRAVNIGELVGVSLELAEAYSPVATAASMLYLFRVSDRYAQRALTIGRQVNEQALVSPDMIIGVHYQNNGQLAESAQLLEHLVQITQKLGDHRRHLDGLHWLSRWNFQRGDYAGAMLLADHLYETATRRQDPRFQALALYVQGFCLLHTGKTQEALHVLRAIVRFFAEDQIVDVPLEKEMTGLLVLAHLRQKAYDLAQSHARQLVTMTAVMEGHSFSNLAVAHAVELYLTLWEQGDVQVQGLAKKAMANLRFYAGVYRIGQPRFWLHQGWQAWLQGKEKKAQQCWQKSLQWAEKHGMAYDRGRVHYEIARHLPVHDPARATHRQTAETIFWEIGARYDLEKCQELA
ncbi:MAG: AAA family ATPase [Chloroflexi bacterium]|nr:AAA family ATPase [Chloroflexota bacterium]MBP8055023.1 AAA family ATPase [Chloroflexota bacterium]